MRIKSLRGYGVLSLLLCSVFASVLSVTASSMAQATSKVPGVITTCPAAGTARAAIMPPMSLGPHQSLVYVYDEQVAGTANTIGHLKRYDTVTGQKVVIVTSGARIEEAQVSLDGQWILFVSVPQTASGQEMLQLVRMDGQFLQTLYCPTSVERITNVQWLSRLAVLEVMNLATNVEHLHLLTLATGSLHQLLATPS
jgi:hypothetical protein